MVPFVTKLNLFTEVTFQRSALYIHQGNNMSLRTTASSFILEAKVTICWPSAQIPNCQCLFCKFVLSKGQYFISRLFQSLSGFSQLNNACKAQAFLNFPFTWVQWSILAATPASFFFFFQKYSSILFHTAIFLGIKPQACSPSATVSLSGTFCNNSRVVSVGTILPAMSLEMLKKSFGDFQAGFFSAELLGISFQD